VVDIVTESMSGIVILRFVGSTTLFSSSKRLAFLNPGAEFH
jgi:hypothetical protein